MKAFCTTFISYLTYGKYQQQNIHGNGLGVGGLQCFEKMPIWFAKSNWKAGVDFSIVKVENRTRNRPLAFGLRHLEGPDRGW